MAGTSSRTIRATEHGHEEAARDLARLFLVIEIDHAAGGDEERAGQPGHHFGHELHVDRVRDVAGLLVAAQLIGE